MPPHFVCKPRDHLARKLDTLQCIVILYEFQIREAKNEKTFSIETAIEFLDRLPADPLPKLVPFYFPENGSLFESC
jgi:hypothetical protein